MMSGFSRVEARISEIESRVSAIEGKFSAPSASVASVATGLTSPGTPPPAFANALMTAQGAAPPVAVPLTGTAPDGQSIRPLSADDLGLRSSALPDAATLDPLIAQSAARYGLPESLIKAVIKTESDGDPHAVSRAGAQGLMQLMPENSAEAGVTDPFDPAQNIDAGSRQLAGFLSKYGGDLDKTLAAYNAGPGAVAKYDGIPPYKETQDYVRKIRSLLDQSDTALETPLGG